MINKSKATVSLFVAVLVIIVAWISIGKSLRATDIIEKFIETKSGT